MFTNLWRASHKQSESPTEYLSISVSELATDTATQRVSQQATQRASHKEFAKFNHKFQLRLTALTPTEANHSQVTPLLRKSANSSK